MSEPTFAEKNIRREADRTGEALTDLLAQGPFDLHRQFTVDRDLALGSHQAISSEMAHRSLKRRAAFSAFTICLVSAWTTGVARHSEVVMQRLGV
jgi:hypothetical protein